MNDAFRLAMLAMLLSTTGLWAQDSVQTVDNVQPPKAPFVARAPAQSSWTVEIKPTDKGPLAEHSISGLPPKYLKQQTWIKSGTKMKCVSSWADGSTTEDWIVGSTEFCQSPQDHGLRFYGPQSDTSNHDFTQGDFAMLDWLTAEDYVHVVNRAGTPCYYYQQTKPVATERPILTGSHNMMEAESKAPKNISTASPMAAYISVQTKLPVEIDTADGQYSFHFQSAPAGELTIPEPILSMSQSMGLH